jgi:hypothetical protein
MYVGTALAYPSGYGTFVGLSKLILPALVAALLIGAAAGNQLVTLLPRSWSWAYDWRWVLPITVVAILSSVLLQDVYSRARGRKNKPRPQLRVPVALVSDVNPIEMGVAAATQEVLDGDRTPKYQPRDVDALIDEAVLKAVTARGDWIVVVEGHSTVGKSRTLFEALRRCEGAGHPLKLVAPAKGKDLRLLLATGYKALGRDEPTVLWLDDLPCVSG